jgi:hypothetical protein
MEAEGANQALEQTRDNVLRYGEVAGCELLNLIDYEAVNLSSGFRRLFSRDLLIFASTDFSSY